MVPVLVKPPRDHEHALVNSATIVASQPLSTYDECNINPLSTTICFLS
jgi:hypothetical protein